MLKEGNSGLFKVAKGLFTCVRRSVILLKDKGLNIVLKGIWVIPLNYNLFILGD